MSNLPVRRGALSFFRNMKTARKLLVGFSVVGLMMVAVGVLGITRLSAAQTNIEDLNKNSLLAIADLGEDARTSRPRRARNVASGCRTSESVLPVRLCDGEPAGDSGPGVTPRFRV